MTRRGGAIALASSLVVFGVCAALIGWRLTRHHPARQSPAEVARSKPVLAEAKPQTSVRVSTIIDLPGDPVLVRRGPVSAPKALRIAVPARLAADAPRADADAYYVNSTLASTSGGYMGKFPEAGQEADALAARLAMNSAQLAGDETQAQIEAGSDDDGGEDTPEDAQNLVLTTANSNQLEVGAGGMQGLPQLKETILRPIVAEKIGDLLVANGFAAESARLVESAAKAAFNVQTLPPQSVAFAVGALDASGEYRAMQLAMFESEEYVGTIALGEDGAYGVGAEPTIPTGMLEETGRTADATTHFNLADGIYSAGLRNGVPEPVIREAIQLIGHLTDLKSPLRADQTLRALFERDFRDKAKPTGRIVYVGLRGDALAVDCYSFEAADGAFRCFEPKGGGESKSGGESKGATAPESLGNSGATSVNGVLAPLKGAPVTSLFGMRFHPILHILRLHAGIDFGAPIGSPVRAAADGRVEIAGPVSGFGNHIRIQHAGFETSYSHLSEIPASIKPGVEVKQGDIIALSGNTGLSTGPHLHFEFYFSRIAVDPLPHLGAEIQSAAARLAPSHAMPMAIAAGGISNAGATPAEIAAYPAAKAIIDAALSEAAN